MRGDPPPKTGKKLTVNWSTPHARGSTDSAFFFLLCRSVYPACAGIHPYCDSDILFVGGLPRMRGDPPDAKDCTFWTNESTPHARGSTPL